MLHTPNYDVRGGSAYCGPTAIAAVTGAPISRIYELIREEIGTKSNGHAMPVIGLSNGLLIRTMGRLGWNVASSSGDTNNRDNPRDIFRFGDFLDSVQMREISDGGAFIVNVTKHYYAVDRDEVCDTATKIPIEIHRFKRGRKRWVKRWWWFEPR